MYNEIINAAIEAMKFAYSPYSHFKVGAALLCSDGTVYTGCNIENSSFGATCCAERIAFFEAVKNGKKEFSAICIVGGRDGEITDFCAPCGICRQVMCEFCSEDFKVVLYNGKEERVHSLGLLMPFGFTGEML